MEILVLNIPMLMVFMYLIAGMFVVGYVEKKYKMVSLMVELVLFMVLSDEELDHMKESNMYSVWFIIASTLYVLGWLPILIYFYNHFR